MTDAEFLDLLREMRKCDRALVDANAINNGAIEDAKAALRRSDETHLAVVAAQDMAGQAKLTLAKALDITPSTWMGA